MSGFNQLTALIMERDWNMLNSIIDTADEKVLRQMASEASYGDLPLHMAIKLEAPTESLMKLLAAYPEARSVKDKKKKSTGKLARDHSADAQFIEMLVKKSREGSSYAKIRRSFSEFIDEARESLKKRFQKQYIFQSR